MKKKLISNTYLRETTKYIFKLFMDNDEYYVSTKKLLEISEPFIINDGKTTAMDTNYYIVEVVPKHENYAMRVFINDKKEIIEYYFDIIKESGIDEETKIPYFMDLYLDITLFGDRIRILDEDELEKALEENDITQEDYELVLKTKDKLINELKNKTNKYLLLDLNKYLDI